MKAIFLFLISALFIYSFSAVICHLTGFCTIEQFTEQIVGFTKDILALFGLVTFLFTVYCEGEK